MKYNKPSLTFEEQADLLLSRKLVADREELIHYLNHVNYYRLSAYLYPFRNSDNSFKNGTTFDIIWQHYSFDRQLRIIVMDVIERFEVSIRTQLVNIIAHHYGPFGYIDIKNFPGADKDKFNKWISEIREEAKRSKETFVEHFKKKYSDVHKDMPIWMIGEIMSFGKILTLYNCVEKKIRQEIAENYHINDEVLTSWLKTINVIRNICAHHGRLWNRILGIKPYIPRFNKYPQWHKPFPINNDRMYSILTILHYLLNIIAPKSEWKVRLLNLLNKYPEIPLSSMGFLNNWNEHSIWRSAE